MKYTTQIFGGAYCYRMNNPEYPTEFWISAMSFIRFIADCNRDFRHAIIMDHETGEKIKITRKDLAL